MSTSIAAVHSTNSQFGSKVGYRYTLLPEVKVEERHLRVVKEILEVTQMHMKKSSTISFKFNI